MTLELHDNFFLNFLSLNSSYAELFMRSCVSFNTKINIICGIWNVIFRWYSISSQNLRLPKNYSPIEKRREKKRTPSSIRSKETTTTTTKTVVFTFLTVLFVYCAIFLASIHIYVFLFTTKRNENIWKKTRRWACRAKHFRMGMRWAIEWTILNSVPCDVEIVSVVVVSERTSNKVKGWAGHAIEWNGV